MANEIEISTGNHKLDIVLNDLPLGLKQHSIRARDKAKELAEIHGFDPEQAGLAGLCHDIARAMKGDDLYLRAVEYNLDIHPVENQIRVLLHGPVGAEILKRDCDIKDPEIIEAIWWHATFIRNLGPVSKITFLADKLDPNKAARFDDLEGKYTLAKKNLDKAILSFLEEDISNMTADGSQIHPASIEGRNWLLGLLN